MVKHSTTCLQQITRPPRAQHARIGGSPAHPCPKVAGAPWAQHVFVGTVIGNVIASDLGIAIANIIDIAVFIDIMIAVVIIIVFSC